MLWPDTTIGSAKPRDCLTKVTTRKMLGHKVMRMEENTASRLSLHVVVGKSVSTEVVAEQEVVEALYNEVDTEEDTKVKGRQEETRITGVLERTTTTMGTRPTLTKGEEITHIEVAAEKVMM